MATPLALWKRYETTNFKQAADGLFCSNNGKTAIFPSVYLIAPHSITYLLILFTMYRVSKKKGTRKYPIESTNLVEIKQKLSKKQFSILEMNLPSHNVFFLFVFLLQQLFQVSSILGQAHLHPACLIKTGRGFKKISRAYLWTESD